MSMEGGRGMTVYGDMVLAVNTAVNFLLLLLGARLCGFPARRLRCLCGALLGGVYAVVTLLPLGFLSTLPVQFLCFILMCFTAYGVRRKTLHTAAVTFLCSAALAGGAFLVTQLCGIGGVLVSGSVYYPLGTRVLLLLAGAFYLAAALLAANALRHGKGELYPVELSCGERTVRISALYDTGATLTDPISGYPVLILEAPRGLELMGLNAKNELLSDPAGALPLLAKKCPQGQFRLVPYRAVGVDGGMLVAMVCMAKIGKCRKKKVLAALSPTAVSDGGGYEALIGGEIL